MSQELKNLFAAPLQLEVGGEVLNVSPARFGLWPQMVEIIGPVLQDMRREQNPPTMADIAMKHAARLIPIAALLTGKPSEWIESLPPDEGLNLIATLVEVNRDFFIQRMAPQLPQLLSKILGQSRSSDPTKNPESGSPDSGPALPSD